MQTSSWKCGAWKLKSPWQVVQRLLNAVTLTYWSCNKEVEGEREETFDPSPISLAEGLFRVIYSHWYANPLCHRQSCWHWRIVDAAFSSSFSFVHLSYKWHENQSCSPSSKSKLPFRTNYNTWYWPSIKRTKGCSGAFHSPDENDTSDLSSDFKTVCIIEKRYVCISCSRRRRKSVPNFSFPTSFNQTTASSSNQTFLLVPDRPPPGEVVQYFEFEMIGLAQSPNLTNFCISGVFSCPVRGYEIMATVLLSWGGNRKSITLAANPKRCPAAGLARHQACLITSSTERRRRRKLCELRRGSGYCWLGSKLS